MNKKEKILKLYYEEHQKQKDIAQEMNVTQSYVSQVIKDDKLSYCNRYTMSDYDFIKCNASAYHRNSKGNLSLVNG